MTRGRGWGALAVLLALAGVVAVVVRPVAPAVQPIATSLDDFSPAVLAAVADYRPERYAAALLASLVTVVVPGLFVFTAGGRRLLDRVGRPRRWPVGAALVGAVVSIGTGLVLLPVAWWSYGHERAWGFSTASVGGWLRDRAVTTGVAMVIAVVAAVVFVGIRRRWPGSWHHRLVLAGTALTALLVLLQPVAIQPLLLSTTPLPEGQTRRAVEEVLRSAGEGELEILVGDASRRTTKVNAYVTGLGPSRQVVLFDTLLTLPPERVAVVVAHELAHREHLDIVRGVLASAAGLLVAFVALRWWLRRAARRRGSVTHARAVGMLLLVLAGGQILAAPITNWASRRAEAAADHRALELTEAVDRAIATQRGFVVRDLADPDPPWWVMALWGTHPSIEQRITAAVAYAERHDLELPSREELTRDEPPPPPGPRG